MTPWIFYLCYTIHFFSPRQQSSGSRDSFWPLSAMSLLWVLHPLSHYCSTPHGTSLFPLLDSSQCCCLGSTPTLLSQLSGYWVASLRAHTPSRCDGDHNISVQSLGVSICPRSLDPDSFFWVISRFFLELLQVLTSFFLLSLLAFTHLVLFSLVFSIALFFSLDTSSFLKKSENIIKEKQIRILRKSEAFFRIKCFFPPYIFEKCFFILVRFVRGWVSSSLLKPTLTAVWFSHINYQ